MQRPAILTATLFSALGLAFIGCTMDFNQFEPTGGEGGSGAATSSSSGMGGEGGVGGGSGGMGGATSSSSSSSSSSSGTGGGTPCNNNAQCPADTACVDWSCVSSTCQATNQPDGHVPTMQTAGDCQEVQCDGMGGEKTVAAPDDKPTDPNPNDCMVPVCNGTTPGTENAPAASACTMMGGGAGKCTAAGQCVQCLAAADCTGMGATCVNNTCQSCDDGVQNGDETGIDCGGSCKACLGTMCMANADCTSNFCADGVCCNAACTGTCRACNVAGSVGMCSNVPLGMEDPNGMMACMNTQACDGAGACKLKNGQPCSMGNGSECLSGKCEGGANKFCVP